MYAVYVPAKPHAHPLRPYVVLVFIKIVFIPMDKMQISYVITVLLVCNFNLSPSLVGDAGYCAPSVWGYMALHLSALRS